MVHDKSHQKSSEADHIIPVSRHHTRYATDETPASKKIHNINEPHKSRFFADGEFNIEEIKISESSIKQTP